jgi:hypothetical protein
MIVAQASVWKRRTARAPQRFQQREYADERQLAYVVRA